MPDYQDVVFQWASHQSGLTGAVVFALGLLYGFQGFRFFTFLLGVTCAFVGLLAGAWASNVFALNATVAAPSVAVALGLAALRWPRFGMYVACTATWALMARFFAEQIGFRPMAALALGLTGGGFGLMFARMCYRSMTVILTTTQGAALLVLGFVILSSAVAPSIGDTFRDWASSWSLLTPVMLGMAFTMTYSYQKMQQQGDILTGR
ncbi:MAG: hypothetical protein AB7Q17_09135 [Phycisphaerae bacterium]